MSVEWLPPKKIKRMLRGYCCPICGTWYQDKWESKECQRECRRRLRR